jgi:hypothetical protein
MGVPIELIGEKLLNRAVAKLAWRKAYGVKHQQVDDGASRARAKVGGLAFFSGLTPAQLPNVKAHGIQVA